MAVDRLNAMVTIMSDYKRAAEPVMVTDDS